MSTFYPKGELVLAHHGIKGQKWGVRRYQDVNGYLTPAGKERYKTRGEGLFSKGMGSYQRERLKLANAYLKRASRLNRKKQKLVEGKGLDPNSEKVKNLKKKINESMKASMDSIDKVRSFDKESDYMQHRLDRRSELIGTAQFLFGIPGALVAGVYKEVSADKNPKLGKYERYAPTENQNKRYDEYLKKHRF